MSLRVVFDTNTVVSALLFKTGKLAWIRDHWCDGGCIPLISQRTAAEVARVLSYRKFGLQPSDRQRLLDDYLPYCEAVDVSQSCSTKSRDIHDQDFLDLCLSGNAHVLVSGDEDLLVLASLVPFAIESPTAYRQRIQNLS